MFSNKLLKVYFTKFLGILGSILSVTIVLPYISSDVEAYGVYSVVISLIMIVNFADLGFLGAGQKYAAEYYAKKDLKSEIEVLSFVHFILFIAIIFYSIFLWSVYFNPYLIFTDLSLEKLNLAKDLILIMIFSSPLVVFKRYISTIYAIRIEDYINQTIEIIINFIKIFSVFYFFKDNKYDIVGYVLFLQIMNLFSIIVNLFIIKKIYKYPLIYVIKSFKFNKSIFKLTKKIAFSSLILSISWIFYYELDPIYVSKLYSSSIVGFFAIGVTILSFSRTLMNIVFSPFQAKFNHFRGLNDEKSLTKIFFQIIELSFPLTLITTIVLIVVMKPLITSWVGIEYLESVFIGRVLITTLFFSFLLSPISYLFFAREKYFIILINAISLPVLYLIFFLILQTKFDYYSLPIAKTLTVFCNVLINLFLLSYLNIENISSLLKRITINSIIPLLVLSFLFYIFEPFWNIGLEKNLINFLQIVSVGGFIGVISISTYYYININCRTLIIKALYNIYKK
jgi:O-antigen/teichoic acid export membrane protein